ncbi:rh13 [macacine betaherpesvirus 3]|uniref:Rh13 n=1 Tax=Rhesus cytomegalovirus (strain 68-1) TaxID=47929 RepID=Q7TFW8_RHCM6|nr:rh13 [macacine betaherpesvirus 3]AAP50540.1 rh13 [macacine betaherpesvirus 3]
MFVICKVVLQINVVMFKHCDMRVVFVRLSVLFGKRCGLIIHNVTFVLGHTVVLTRYAAHSPKLFIVLLSTSFRMTELSHVTVWFLIRRETLSPQGLNVKIMNVM